MCLEPIPPSPDQSKYTVHIIPHSHDDVGWKSCVEWYYNNWVHNIIESVIKELENNKCRKFPQVEVKYFSMWWDQQTEKKRNSVKKLIENGQLHFIGGGWA